MSLLPTVAVGIQAVPFVYLSVASSVLTYVPEAVFPISLTFRDLFGVTHNLGGPLTVHLHANRGETAAQMVLFPWNRNAETCAVRYKPAIIARQAQAVGAAAAADVDLIVDASAVPPGLNVTAVLAHASHPFFNHVLKRLQVNV